MGRILVVEFSEQESWIFDEIMEILNQYPDFQYLHLGNEPMLSIPISANLSKKCLKKYVLKEK